MKKLLILTISIIMAFFFVACGENPTTDSGKNPPDYVAGTEGLKYMVNTDNVSATFIGLGTATGSEITIASHYEGVPVTKIKRAALYENETVVKVNIPKQLKSIGPSAFMKATKLETVSIPNDTALEEIGAYAFKNCTALKNLDIPLTVKVFGEEAVDGCPNFVLNDYKGGSYLGSSVNPYIILMRATSSDVTSLTVSKDCRIIYANSFYNCKKLESISFESDANLTAIGNDAFGGCSSLKELTIPSSVERIGASAFGAQRSSMTTMLNEGCTSLTKVTFSKDSKLTYLGERAFDDCVSLVSVVNFEYTKLTEVLTGTFMQCTKLNSIKLPKTVTVLNKWVFARCKNLQPNSVFNENGYLQKIEQGVFRENHSYDNVVVPETVTYIGDLCFSQGNTSKVIYLKNPDISTLHVNWNVLDGYGNRITYYVYSETNKAGGWRYVNGVPTVW